jgi:hypothetical protein
MAAFQEGSFDVARRLIGEILIDDPGHAGARALRTRLEARTSSAASGRSGHTPTPGAIRSAQGGRAHIPEATSVDPTVLIDRASSAFQPPEYIEPTVVVQREDLHRRREPAREAAPPRPLPPPPPPSNYSARSEAPAPEPTLLIPSKKRAGSSAPAPSFWQRLTGAGGAQRSSRRQPAAGRQSASGFSTPTARGAGLVLGAVVVAALLVAGTIFLYRVMFPNGHLLTVTRPQGGTIVGAGLECGTRGSDCTVTRPVDDAVELQPVADSGYVFTGFTGDCAPSGRVLMTQPRACGATFATVGGAAGEKGVAWALTILRPTGGTIVAEGIICGKLGESCSASLQDGTKVALQVETDEGFQFVQFTGDCSPSGETTMTAARTCSATFQPSPKPLANQNPDRPRAPTDRERPAVSGGGQKGTSTGAGTPAAGGAPAPTVPAPPATGGSPPATSPQTPAGPSQTPAPTGQTGLVPTNTPGGDAPKVGITPEEHAKKEIDQLVKNYCAAMETLKPEELKKLYPQVDVALHRELFRQYKSLKCTLAGPPEYDRLDASAAGGAQIKVGMKQQIEMKSGGAPKVLETIATIIMSRMSNQSPWQIDRLQHVPKPK